MRVGIEMIARQLQVELADLSSVADPVGRIDYLASKTVEQAVRALPAEVQMTYHAARPLIDGLFAKHLGGVRVAVPEEVRNMFAQLQQLQQAQREKEAA